MYSRVYTSNAIYTTNSSNTLENTRELDDLWYLPPLAPPPPLFLESQDVWLVEALISRGMFIPGLNSSQSKWKALARDFNTHFNLAVGSVELREHALGELYRSLLVVLGEVDDISSTCDDFITSTSVLQIARDSCERHQVSSPDSSSSAEAIDSYMTALNTLSTAAESTPPVLSSSRYKRSSPPHQRRDVLHQQSSLVRSYDRSTVDFGVFSEDNFPAFNDSNSTSSSDGTDDDDDPSALEVYAGGTDRRGDHQTSGRGRSFMASVQYAYPVHTSSEQRKGSCSRRFVRSMRASSPNALYNAFVVPMLHEPLRMVPIGDTEKAIAAAQESHTASPRCDGTGSDRWLLMHRDRSDAATIPQLRTVTSMHAAAEQHAKLAQETQERNRVQKTLAKAEKITNAFSAVWVDVRVTSPPGAGDSAVSSSPPPPPLLTRTPPLSAAELCAALGVPEAALHAKQWLDADDCHMRAAHGRAVLAAQARHAVVGRELAARRANGRLTGVYGFGHAYAPAACVTCGAAGVCACLCAAAVSASSPWRWTHHTMARTLAGVTHTDRVRGVTPPSSPSAPSTDATQLAAPHTPAGGTRALPQMVAAALGLARAPLTSSQETSCLTPGYTPGVAVQTDVFPPAGGVYRVYHTQGAQAARAAVRAHRTPLSCGRDSRGAYTTHHALPQPATLSTSPGQLSAPLLAAAETIGMGADAESLARLLDMKLIEPQPTAPPASWGDDLPDRAVAAATCGGAAWGTALDAPLTVAGSALLAPLQQLHVLHASAQRLATQVGPVSLAPVLGAYERELMRSVHAALHRATAQSAHFYSVLLEAGLHACVTSAPDAAGHPVLPRAPAIQAAQVVAPAERTRLCMHEGYGAGAAAGAVWWRVTDSAMLPEAPHLISEPQPLPHRPGACTAAPPQTCSGAPLPASENAKHAPAGHAWVRVGSALAALAPTAELYVHAEAQPRPRAGLTDDCIAWVDGGSLQHSLIRHTHSHDNPLVTGARTGRFVKLVKVSRAEAASMSVESVLALLARTEHVGALPKASSSRAEHCYPRVGRATYHRVPRAADLPAGSSGAGATPLRAAGPRRRSRSKHSASSVAPYPTSPTAPASPTSSSSRPRATLTTLTSPSRAANDSSIPLRPLPYRPRGCSCGLAPPPISSVLRACTVQSRWRPPEPLPLRPGDVVPTLASVTRAAAATGVCVSRGLTAVPPQSPPLCLAALVVAHTRTSASRMGALETDIAPCAECDGRGALRRIRIAPCLPWVPPSVLASSRAASARAVVAMAMHASLRRSMKPPTCSPTTPPNRAQGAVPTPAEIYSEGDPDPASASAASLYNEHACLDAACEDAARTSGQKSPSANHGGGLCTNTATVTSDDDLYSSDDDLYSSDDDLYSSDDDLYSSDDDLYSSDDDLYSSDDDLYSNDSSEKETLARTDSSRAPRKTTRSVTAIGAQGAQGRFVGRTLMRQTRVRQRVRGGGPMRGITAQDYRPSLVRQAAVACTATPAAAEAPTCGSPRAQRQRCAGVIVEHHSSEPSFACTPLLDSALSLSARTSAVEGYRVHRATLIRNAVELPVSRMADANIRPSHDHARAHDQTTSSALGPGFALYQHLAQLAAQRVFRGALAWDWVPVSSCLAHFPTRAQQSAAQRHHHGLSLLQELDPSSASLFARPECGAGDPSRVATLPAASLLARGRLGAWRCSFHALVRTIERNRQTTRTRDARGPQRAVAGGSGVPTNRQRALTRVPSSPVSLSVPQSTTDALSLSFSGEELSIAEECVARLDSGAMQIWMLRAQSWADLFLYSRHNPYLRRGPPALAYALELGWLTHSARAFDSRVDSLVRTTNGPRVCSTAPVAAPATEPSLFSSVAPSTLSEHPPVGSDRPRISSAAKELPSEARAVSFLSRLRPLGLDMPVVVRATLRCCREGLFGDCHRFPPCLSATSSRTANPTQLPRQLPGASGAFTTPFIGVGTRPVASHNTRRRCASLKPVEVAALAHAVGPQMHPLLLKTLRPFEACHAVVHACTGMAGLLHSSLFFELACRLTARVLAWRVGGLVTGTARWLPWTADRPDRASSGVGVDAAVSREGGGATTHDTASAPPAHPRPPSPPTSSSSTSSFSFACDPARVPPTVRATLEAPPFLFPPKPKARGSMQTEQATTSLLRQRLSAAAPPYDLSPRMGVLLRWHVAVQQHAAMHQLAAAALVRLACAHEEHAYERPQVPSGVHVRPHSPHIRACGCSHTLPLTPQSQGRLFAPPRQACKQVLGLSPPTQVYCCQCGAVVSAPSLRLLLAVPGVFSTSAALDRHKSQATLNEAVPAVVKRAYAVVPCVCGASWPCSSHAPTSLPEHVANVDWASITLTGDIAMLVDAVPVSLPKPTETAPRSRACACLVAETMLRWAGRHLHVRDGVYVWTLPPDSKWSHLLQCHAVLSLLHGHASFLRASEMNYAVLANYAQKCVADLFIRCETIEKTAAHDAEAELQWKRERISLARTRERNLCGDLELDVVRGELRSANRHHHIFSTLAPKPLHQGRIVRTTSTCDRSSNKDEREHHQDASISKDQHPDVSARKTKGELGSYENVFPTDAPLRSTNTLIDSSSSAEDIQTKRHRPHVQASQMKYASASVVTLKKRTQLDDDD